MSAYKRLFQDDIVNASSVEDFAARYRRHDRYGALPESQREAILRVHRQEIEIHGITWIAGYDSNTGGLVSWSPDDMKVGEDS
jgi:hypothetical protein